MSGSMSEILQKVADQRFVLLLTETEINYLNNLRFIKLDLISKTIILSKPERNQAYPEMFPLKNRQIFSMQIVQQ
jgi:hypothetical protein